MEIGSPLGLLKLQRTIVGVKTIRIEELFISLENYWSVDVWNGFVWPIWTSTAQVLQKEGVGIKLVVWLLTTKNQESDRPHVCRWSVTLLESSWQELQFCCKLHPNWRSERVVIAPQSCRSLNLGSFGTPLWEFWDEKLFGCRRRGEAWRILHRGRWWLPSSPGCGESCESKVTCGLS
jgi:hypothetical protein